MITSPGNGSNAFRGSVIQTDFGNKLFADFDEAILFGAWEDAATVLKIYLAHTGSTVLLNVFHFICTLSVLRPSDLH